MNTSKNLINILLGLGLGAGLALAGHPEDPINLNSAGDFVILAKSGISTVPSSDITGDMGVSPITSTAITGFSLI
ncbi:MAG: ice-binding family protein, partial [Kiritimatiellia bacterium]